MPDAVLGLREVGANLSREVRKIHMKTVEGMVKAGHLVQAESMRRTPVDTGNLRGGCRLEWEELPAKGGVKVVVSYQATYSIFVHEVKARHTVGDWKFLERAVAENWARIIQIIRAEAMI